MSVQNPLIVCLERVSPPEGSEVATGQEIAEAGLSPERRGD